VIQRFLEDPLAEDIIRGTFASRLKKKHEGESIKIKASLKGDALRFE
jgi:hypothetical protein